MNTMTIIGNTLGSKTTNYIQSYFHNLCKCNNKKCNWMCYHIKYNYFDSMYESNYLLLFDDMYNNGIISERQYYTYTNRLFYYKN